MAAAASALKRGTAGNAATRPARCAAVTMRLCWTATARTAHPTSMPRYLTVLRTGGGCAKLDAAFARLLRTLRVLPTKT
eukprot:5089843-Lingulodinium_polyedra.AAC.1